MRTEDQYQELAANAVEPRQETVGITDLIREAKLYYSAFRKAEDAGGRVFDPTKPDGMKVHYERDISNARRWRIGNRFIARHKDDEDRKGARAKTLKTPSSSDPFWATSETRPGDAKATYKRLMMDRFPISEKHPAYRA